MFKKFVSRKFFMAVAAFIAVSVLPNLSAGSQAKAQVIIAAVYTLAQGAVDFAAVVKGSGGTTP